jgi:hypothetical protein
MRPETAALAHEVRRTGLMLYERSREERAWIEARLEGIWLDLAWLRQIERSQRAEGRGHAT